MTPELKQLLNNRVALYYLLLDNYQQELAKASFTNESLELEERVTAFQHDIMDLEKRLDD
jgi:hypothetical protein